MTLAGYMPPLCDPEDGNLLVDGGYTNNLPADVLRQMGCSVVFTVDVGAPDEKDLANYGDELSGWSVIAKRFLSFGKLQKVPNIADIQSRLAYVACQRQLEQVRQQPYCIYIRPPIDKYKTLSFNLFDEINKVGYNYGRKFFSIINIRSFFMDLYNQRTNAIKSAATPGKLAAHTFNNRIQVPQDFTELAEMVTRLDDEMYETIDENDEEEEADSTSLPGDLSADIVMPSTPLIHQAGKSLSALENDSSNSNVNIASSAGGDAGQNSSNSSRCGNSRRNSLKSAQNLQKVISSHLYDDFDDEIADDDGEDFDDDDTVFDEFQRAITEQNRSLSDTELRK